MTTGKEGESQSRELTGETSWNAEGMSHEQLVDAFRGFIRQREHLTGGYISPEEIIRQKLNLERQTWPSGDETMNEQRTESFFHLLEAWDALAYERYRPGSSEERLAGTLMELYYQDTKQSVIPLSPAQARAIDALTEAVGIPHQKGQKDIHVPEKLRKYTAYQMSPEYQNRVARAKR